MIQLKLLMALQVEAAVSSTLASAIGLSDPNEAQIAQILQLRYATARCCQQRGSVPKTFLLHGDGVNSSVFSLPILRSHGFISTCSTFIFTHQSKSSSLPAVFLQATGPRYPRQWY